VILKLTRMTAELVGESAAEWQALEKCVRLGQWISGPRTDEARLRQIAAKLRVPLRVESIAVLRSRSRQRRRSAT
jgi:hypothetical protein